MTLHGVYGHVMSYEAALGVTSVKSNGKQYPQVRMVFPAPLTRALIERGFTRVSIEVTDEGLLLRPFVGDKSGAVAALPEEWGSDG